MGLGRIFSSKANFDNIIQTRVSGSQVGLKVSNVVHKAFVEIDEIGSKAAAATGKVLWVLFNILIDLLRLFIIRLCDRNYIYK